jgi:hypothetical protein
MIVTKEELQKENRAKSHKKNLLKEWDEKLGKDFEVLKGTYVSNKDFWQLEINKRKKYSN